MAVLFSAYLRRPVSIKEPHPNIEKIGGDVFFRVLGLGYIGFRVAPNGKGTVKTLALLNHGEKSPPYPNFKFV